MYVWYVVIAAPAEAIQDVQMDITFKLFGETKLSLYGIQDVQMDTALKLFGYPGLNLLGIQDVHEHIKCYIRNSTRLPAQSKMLHSERDHTRPSARFRSSWECQRECITNGV